MYGNLLHFITTLHYYTLLKYLVDMTEKMVILYHLVKLADFRCL